MLHGYSKDMYYDYRKLLICITVTLTIESLTLEVTSLCYICDIAKIVLNIDK